MNEGTVKRLTSTERFAALALSFPALEGAPGVHPWDPIELLRWSLPASHGERVVVQFLLGVWNPGTNWELEARRRHIIDSRSVYPRFDLFEAVNILDESNLAALRAWLEDPFFP